MIRAAAEAGVDTIKFQSFTAGRLSKDYPNYHEAFRYYRAHELSADDHLWLLDECGQCGIGFLTTAFDVQTVGFLASIGVKEVKIASPDANNWPLIDKCLEKFDRVVISTGMHTADEIERLIAYVAPSRKVTLLHCVSLYPTPLEAVNMEMLRLYKSVEGIDVGFSDHTLGLDAAKLAIAFGAAVLERHYTLSRHLPGKDHFFSSTPEEFKELVDWRNRVRAMVGDGRRELGPEELRNRELYQGRWRRS